MKKSETLELRLRWAVPLLRTGEGRKAVRVATSRPGEKD